MSIRVWCGECRKDTNLRHGIESKEAKLEDLRGVLEDLLGYRPTAAELSRMAA